MRAATITAHGRPPEVLDRDDPVPGPGRLLVAVTAVPITPLDLLCASGTSYFGAPALPYVPGVQAVGVVRDGPAELVGRRVWFPTTAGMAPGDGGLAELAVADPAEVVVVEADLPDASVAALGLSAVAAWQVLEGRAAAAARRDGARARGRRCRRTGRRAGRPPARCRPRRRGGPLDHRAGAGPGLRCGCRGRPA